MIEDLKKTVTAAGKVLLNLRNDQRTEGEWKGSQYKAYADSVMHDCLVKHLRDFAPDIPVVSEEDPDSWKSAFPAIFFLIDPIDGTASFAQGFDGFVTQVALVKHGAVHCSAICHPLSGSLFWAVRGRGAYCNKRQLRITNKTRLGTIIDNYPQPRGITRSAVSSLHIQYYIECGSIALKICKVADNTADIFFKNVPVQQWDLAAPHLILTESGGILYDIWGRDINYVEKTEYEGIVAANSKKNAKRLLAWYSNSMHNEVVP